MPKWEADRVLPVLAALISLALTALTVAAVMRQGQTLEARERDDIRADADQEIAQRARRLRRDLQTWLAQLETAEADGPAAIDAWIANHPAAWFVCIDRENEVNIYPRTPTAAPLPLPRSEALARGETLEFDERDPAGALRYYEALVDDDDPEVRAAALLGVAANQRKLGALRVAGRSYEQVADLLRERGQPLAGALGAWLAATDCFQQDGDVAAAKRALAALLDLLEAAPPGTWGEVEFGMIRARAAALGESADAALRQRLARLAERATVRGALPRVRAALFRAYSAASLGGEPEYVLIAATPEPLVLAVGRQSDGGRVGLVFSRNNLIKRYWRGPQAPLNWRVAAAEDPLESPTLTQSLPASFGGLPLAPSQETLIQLQRGTQWRWAVLLAVTGGLAGAWALVIWLMGRVLAHQRELVHLQRRFVADVSHELKTPLALIRLHAETLSEGRVRDAKRAGEYYQTISRESERLTVLIDNILDFSRIEAGRKRYEMTPCDVGEVARQAWLLFEPSLMDDGFACELKVSPQLPPVQADAQALTQVLVNLLQNAQRYSDEQKTVRLTVERQRNDVVLAVSDRGIGLSKTQIRRLGRLFERGDDPQVRRTRGTGLGLAIVKHIIDAHGGQLEVRSELGRGSTFVVRLPIRGEG